MIEYALLDSNDVLLQRKSFGNTPVDPVGKGWRWVEYATITPQPPADYSDETYYRTEQDDAPYVIYTRKSDEVIAELFVNKVVGATQSRLDTFAQTRNYDSILSACTYATSVIPKFQTEGQYCVNARDLTWSSLYYLMGEVQAGTRPMPSSVEEVMELLPVLEWPQE